MIYFFYSNYFAPLEKKIEPIGALLEILNYSIKKNKTFLHSKICTYCTISASKTQDNIPIEMKIDVCMYISNFHRLSLNVESTVYL